MIFNCPSCSAGHSVPVSMIPNGGLDMLCRRCADSFRIDMPKDAPAEDSDGEIDELAELEGGAEVESEDETEAAAELEELESLGSPIAEASSTTSPERTSIGSILPDIGVPEKTTKGSLANVEPTAIGVANPFDENAGADRPLMSPSGQSFPSPRAAKSAIDRGADTRPEGVQPDTIPGSVATPIAPRDRTRGDKGAKTAVTTGRPVPLGADEQGVDPELDETVRVDTDDERMPAPGPVPTVTSAEPRPPQTSPASSQSPPPARAQHQPPQKLSQQPTKITVHDAKPSEPRVPAHHAGPAVDPRAITHDGRGLASEAPREGAPSPLTHDSRTVRPTDPPRPASARGDLYDRVAAGVYVPEERPPVASASGSDSDFARVKPWNVRSAYVESSRFSRFVKPARKLAETLNRLPLPLKVGLVVFPLALGLVLVITSGRNPWSSDDPVQIAVTPPAAVSAAIETQPALAAAATKETPREPTSTPPARELTARAAEVVRPSDHARPVFRGDDTAAEGQAYVQVDRARLRTHASDDGQMVAKLELGQLVKKFDGVGDWVLVMALPNGPAGFISERLLGPKKPIALLAREVAFAGCESAVDRPRDECLYEGKQQHDACLASCGLAIGPDGAQVGSDPSSSPAMRCAEACRVAFTECQRSCNEEPQGRTRKKARR